MTKASFCRESASSPDDETPVMLRKPGANGAASGAGFCGPLKRPLTVAWAVVFVVCVTVHLGQCYNVDVLRPIIFEDPGIGGGWNGRSSYFGFSVALHNFTDAVTDPTTWLLVGAPRANRTEAPRANRTEAPRANRTEGLYPAGQKIQEPGVLYKCSLWSGTNACKEVVVDRNGNMQLSTSPGSPLMPFEIKDNGWLGVSLDAQPMDNGRIVVCAHLRKQDLQTLSSTAEITHFYATNGICYWTFANLVSKTDNTQLITVRRLAPLDDTNKQTNNQKEDDPEMHIYSVGQVGMSAHFPKNVSELIMGAPGVNSWRGSVVRARDTRYDFSMSSASRRRRRSASLDDRSNGVNERNDDYHELLQNDGIESAADELEDFSRQLHRRMKREVWPFSDYKDIPELYYDSSVQRNSYWGYAVSSGIFGRDGKTLYVTSAPRAEPNGKAFIFNYTRGGSGVSLHVHWEFNGRQLGEYFGASVAALDVNGDGLDDLVVGAPMHSMEREDRVVKPDQGRVALYLNDGSMGFSEEPLEVFGSEAPMARFGTTLSAVGDINRDGFEDLAVGAPFEDNSAGVVFLYYGARTGFAKNPQIIKGSELFSGLKGFGISISRGVDMDQNKYPDIGVGAFESGHAVILRSKPVARITGTITSDPPELNITQTDFTVMVCLEFSGHDVPLRQDVVVDLQIDAQQAVPRVAFRSGEGKSTMTYETRLEKGKRSCEKAAVRVVRGVKDFSKALEVVAKYGLKERIQPEPVGRSASIVSATVSKPVLIKMKKSDSGMKRRPKRQPQATFNSLDHDDFCKTCVVLDRDSSTEVTAAVPFMNGCGDDSVCSADLSVDASWSGISDPFAIGSRSTARMAVRVKNVGEPAFGPMVSIKLPKDFGTTLLPSGCLNSDVGEDGRRSIECQLPSPLGEDQQAKIELEVSFSHLEPTTTHIDVDLNAYSVSRELNETDNSFKLVLNTVAQADITITGESISREYFYTKNTDRAPEDREKPNVVSIVQNFQIVKYFDTPVEEVVAWFMFPSGFIPEDKHEPLAFFFNITATGSSSSRRPECSRVDGLSAGDFQDLRNTRYRRSTGKTDTTEATQELTNDTVIVGEAHFSSLLALPNVTFELNCTSPSKSIVCSKVMCPIGPFGRDGSAVDLSFELKVDMRVIEPYLGNKSTLLYKTDAVVHFGHDTKDLDEQLSAYNHRSDNTVVSTYLTPNVIMQREWPYFWIAIAVIGGILIVMLIAGGLMKAGFFKRARLDEIKEMKAQEALLGRSNDNGGGHDDDGGPIDTGGAIVIP